MQKYRDIDHDSGVDEFEILPTAILIKFEKTKTVYTYSYTKPGQQHVENMKKLALSGEGLNAYINENVYKKFESKRG